MTFFLTGSTGLIGSHLLNELARYDYKVRALRRSGSKPRIALAKEPEWIEGSLPSVSAADLEGVDCLIHLAATGIDPTNTTWEDCFQINVMESLNLWIRAARAGVRNFIITGSCFEYGSSGESFEYIPANASLRPVGPYHASKAAATMAASGFATSERVKVWVLRPFHIYGEGEAALRLYPQILAAASVGQDLELTAGEQVRDFVEVTFAARLFHGFARLLAQQTDPAFFAISNLGTGRPQRLRDWVESVWNAHRGSGTLHFGKLPYRRNEVMRFVPQIDLQEQEAALAAIPPFV